MVTVDKYSVRLADSQGREVLAFRTPRPGDPDFDGVVYDGDRFGYFFMVSPKDLKSLGEALTTVASLVE